MLVYHVRLLDDRTLLDKAKRPADRCDANFYIGSRYWHSGNKKKAAEWFKKSAMMNMHDLVEFYGAKIRLVQLSDP